MANALCSLTQLSSYLPDEILLEILSYLPNGKEGQTDLASFCLVCRQWYDVAIRRLYKSPHLAGRRYELFVRTLCPSILPHIRKSELAGLVKVLDLSHIVHHGTKSTTARLLGRTKFSLEVFIAPQASFAINCWASLSKCVNLHTLNLSLVSECISYQALNQTICKLPKLTAIHLPRCSSNYDTYGVLLSLQWPPRLRYLALAGNADMLGKPESFPPSLSSLSISHAPLVEADSIRQLLTNLADSLTNVELRDLPRVEHGELNGVLDWCTKLESLIISVDYIDVDFGNMPDWFNSSHWMSAKPLQKLRLVNSGHFDIDPRLAFQPVDLFTLIDERFLGRIRQVDIASSVGWHAKDDGGEIEAVATALIECDKENWIEGRWHYSDRFGFGKKEREKLGAYEAWRATERGTRTAPRLRVYKDS
ncbi:hypothetical protein CC78DRAFT_538403 [Lojkania enalia]|uniref:F-box domain-containing protein n=1 Tax=Lojkania enalia TaxID=147567 RepID=A0A9P4N0G7_9PLEO|nr:hypothetical protein CC78DRAFT_538403 [Didymosphaeria enalia]